MGGYLRKFLKYDLVSDCFTNEYFPDEESGTGVYDFPIDQLPTSCMDGYCPCP